MPPASAASFLILGKSGQAAESSNLSFQIARLSTRLKVRIDELSAAVRVRVSSLPLQFRWILAIAPQEDMRWGTP
jgi:hypothetical protein